MKPTRRGLFSMLASGAAAAKLPVKADLLGRTAGLRAASAADLAESERIVRSALAGSRRATPEGEMVRFYEPDTTIWERYVAAFPSGVHWHKPK